jgi:hypothetical protein
LNFFFVLYCSNSVMGSKTHKFQSKIDKSGIELVPVDEKQSNQFCISTNTAREIARALSLVHKIYKDKFSYENIDTELAGFDF